MSKVVIIPSDALEQLGSKRNDNFLLRKLLKALDPDKKKKEEKKPQNWSEIHQVALLGLITMPITGPLYLLCMAVMWRALKTSLP